jgi:hypothetical protein
MRKFDKASIRPGMFLHGGTHYSDGAFRRGEAKLSSVDGVPYDEHAPDPRLAYIQKRTNELCVLKANLDAITSQIEALAQKVRSR